MECVTAPSYFGSNIRRARVRRRITASRRLERQRRGEVPALAPGFVEVSSNYYTGYHSAVGTKRAFAFGLTTEAKRSRKSQVASVSDDDNEEPCDSEGFAAVADSEDEQPNNYMLSEEMREQVEIFLNLQKAQEKAQDYFQFESWDSPECYALYRDLNYDNPDVLPVNTAFTCRYMVRGFLYLWDVGRMFPYATD